MLSGNKTLRQIQHGWRKGRYGSSQNKLIRNEILDCLVGYYANISAAEEGNFIIDGKSDLLMMKGFNNRNCDVLVLGLLSFVNQGCKPKILHEYRNGILSCIACKNIEPGEEILVSYGKNYFENGKCECDSSKPSTIKPILSRGRL